jgi:predicted nucleic acid-binding protein
LKKYALDSNIFITAARNEQFAGELIRFTERFLPQLYLHAVVVQELYIGAINGQARGAIERNIAQPFEKRGRLIVPSYTAWKRSGEIVAVLVEKRVLTAGGIPKSFMNDVVLAASCREEGVEIVTLNERDFSRIRPVEKVAYSAPWPSR